MDEAGKGYLAVPQEQRARLIHEKARAARRGEVYWLRSYLVDVLDDLELNREGPLVRFVAFAFPHLAARVGWVIPDDHRAIAGELVMRPQDVRRALDRLVEMGRIERITTGGDRLPDGGFQSRLDFSTTEPMPSQGRASSDLEPSQARAEAEPQPWQLRSHAPLDDDPASRGLARAREQSRAERTKDFKAEQTVTSSVGPALPLDSQNGKDPVILGRMIGLVCRGDEASAAILRAEAAGMPEHVLARALESYIGRRPRPANPAGYVINAIRSIAAEAGIVRERVRIEREPPL
jgi:hypothetical protein